MASLATPSHLHTSYLLEPSPLDDDTQRGRKRRRSSASNHTTSHGSTTLRGRGRHRTPSPSSSQLQTRTCTPSQTPNSLFTTKEGEGSETSPRKSPGKKYQRFQQLHPELNDEDTPSSSRANPGLPSTKPRPVPNKQKTRRSQSLSRSRSRGERAITGGDEKARIRRRQRTRTRCRSHGEVRGSGRSDESGSEEDGKQDVED